MDFDIDVSDILQVDENGIGIIDGTRSVLRGPQHYASGSKTHPHQKLLNEIVDSLGDVSAKEQGLPAPVTTSLRFFSSDERLYILAAGFKVVGMIKVGHKKLFVRDEVGNVREIEPLCVLDFCTFYDYQRKGYGRVIYETMLKNEKVAPHKLGYDRPSSKFLSFLSKYYGLENFVKQANNFVVFNNYFADDKKFRCLVKDPVTTTAITDVQFPVRSTKPVYTAAPYNTYEPKAPAYAEAGFAAKQNYDSVPSGKMPSYKEAMKLNNSRGFSGDAPVKPTYAEEEKFVPISMDEESLPPPAYKAPAEEPLRQIPESSVNPGASQSRKVHFAETSPEVYQIPAAGYEQENDPTLSTQNQEPSAEHSDLGYAKPAPAYAGYGDGYTPPAGKNYMNPNIEQDQVSRRFNRTSMTEGFKVDETVKESFNYPEAEGPLNVIDERRKQQLPVEYSIK